MNKKKKMHSLSFSHLQLTASKSAFITVLYSTGVIRNGSYQQAVWKLHITVIVCVYIKIDLCGLSLSSRNMWMNMG